MSLANKFQFCASYKLVRDKYGPVLGGQDTLLPPTETLISLRLLTFYLVTRADISSGLWLLCT